MKFLLGLIIGAAIGFNISTRVDAFEALTEQFDQVVRIMERR